jgi:hypothetical protein
MRPRALMKFRPEPCCSRPTSSPACLLTPVMNHAAVIDHISPPLVRAFAHLVEHPDQWFTAVELIEATGTSKATIYRRFGNLVAAEAVISRRVAGFRQFKLHPSWDQSKLGRELHIRGIGQG